MALVLLSESRENKNKELMNAVIEMLPKEPSVAYIPSKYDPLHKNYGNYVSGLVDLVGLEDINHYALERELWEEDFRDKILENNVLFLPGGNTFRFLYWMKKRDLGDIISEFAENRLIIAISAGAIALTPRVDISRDDNVIDLEEFEGYGIVDFYFKPHFKDNDVDNKHIEDYLGNRAPSDTRKIYACCDRSGLIVQNNDVKIIGEVFEF